MTAERYLQDRPGDPFLHEYFARFRPGPHPADPAAPRICFLVGSTDISGGTYVILQHALHAARHGAEVVLVPHMHDEHNDWHPALRELPVRTLDEVGDAEFDLAVATWWLTVFDLPSIRCRHAVYLVQSVEARFALGREDQRWVPALAELTYTFDLPVITIARYLGLYLGLRHRRPAFLVHNGIRKDLYTPFGPAVEPRRDARLRVLVEGSLGVPMKNVDDSVRLARAGGADEVWLLTPSEVGVVAGVDRVFSRIPVEVVPTVYRSCDVLLKLSLVEGMYGPPLEMFHCGGTVVTYDVTGHEEYVRHGVNGLVAPMGDQEAVMSAIRSLKADRALLARLRRSALQTADRWPDWEASSQEFLDLVLAIIRQPPADLLQTMLAIRGARCDLP